MEENKDFKKVVLPAILGVIALIVLTVGATYAYFTVSSLTTGFTRRTVKAQAPEVGNVALASGSNLSITLTAEQMMKGTNDITYYASSSGVTTTATTENIGVATVTGAGTFNCEYKLNVSLSATSAEKNMYTKFNAMTDKSAGQIVLTINGVDYDFSNTTFPKEISGTMTDLKAKTSAEATDGVNGYITAALKIVNSKTANQTDLAGTDITVNFDIVDNSFKCTATA